MTDELTICAAAFLRNKGKNVVTENEFLMGISMDLHWMPYGDAKVLLAALLNSKILEKNGEYLKPTFDVSGITDVPVGYRPGPDFVSKLKTKNDVPVKEKTAPMKSSAPTQDLFPMMIEEAVETGMEKRDFISEANNIQKKLNVDITVAGLMVLRDRGADIGPLADRVYASLKN